MSRAMEAVPGPVDGDATERRERIVLLVLASVQFTNIVDFMVVMPLGPKLMPELEIDTKQFGLIVSSYTIAAGLMGLVASTVVDRFDRRRAYLTMFVGFLIGTLLCGLSSSYALLLLARVVTGSFGGVLGGMSLAIIGDVFPEQRRGRATGILMSAFALASVAGVPLGLWLGTTFGWQVPFLVLAALGLPVLGLGIRALPTLQGHLARGHVANPLQTLINTFTEINHLRAFALMFALMFGGFAVIPYISTYLVWNVGFPIEGLWMVFMAGGACTLISSPLIGRLADRFGKLLVFRVISPFSAAMMIVLTNLPKVGIPVAMAAVAGLMVSNAGRMVAAMAMMTSSVEPRRRGGFMSANSAVQHLATGLGAGLGGWIITEGPDRALEHFPIVGLIAATSTLIAIWLGGRLRYPAPQAMSGHVTASVSLGAAAEATADCSEPMEVAVDAETPAEVADVS